MPMSAGDPNSVTVMNPIHRSPQFAQDSYPNGFGHSPQQQLEAAVAYHYPAGYRASSEPSYPRQPGGYGLRASTASDPSSNSALQDSYNGHFHYTIPQMAHPPLTEETSDTSLPNTSLSGQRVAPPQLKPPKDRKVVTLSAVCLERGRGGGGDEGWEEEREG